MKVLLVVLVLSLSVYVSAQNLKSYTRGSVTLYYEESGAGPPLYILSGGPGEAPYYPYRQLADSLKSFYTCIVVHQRGSGMSAIPINSQTITIDNYTQDLEALRNVRGDKQVTLLGMSWGGLLAMNYAANFPDRVSDLILVCSAPPSYTVWNVLFDNQYARRSKPEVDSMAMLEQLFSERSERELDSLKRIDRSHPQVVAYREYMALHIRAMYYDKSKISKAHFDELFYSFNFQPIPLIDKEVLETKWDITDKLKKLKVPALIVYGRQDDQGESTFYLQRESLRFSETHVIEQCGHEILEEQPEKFYSILFDYVRRRRAH